MDPVASQGINLVKAVQALLVRQGGVLEGSPLQALMGQDLSVLLQSQGPEGAILRLPSGQAFTAQGQLPFPEGTQLQVRVLPQAEGGIQLQVRGATPPGTSPLLIPLAQSEAQSLMARLTQDPPPAPLEPLVRLMNLLSGSSTPAPSLGTQVAAALPHLPEALQRTLGQVLGLGASATSQDLASTLATWIHQAAKTSGETPGTADPLGNLAERTAALVLARFDGLLTQRTDLPVSHREPLSQFIRSLLNRPDGEADPLRSRASVGLPDLPSAGGARRTTSSGASQEVRLVPSLPPQPPLASSPTQAEHPETWQAWIRGSIEALTQPSISPREAPFHALQAKEGTAFFEIPLPWTPASPLQIWVESEASHDHGPPKDQTHRVLLGLQFSILGETRLGLAQTQTTLQVRIWTEHPETLEAQRDAIQTELEALGRTVDLRFYAITYGPDGTIPTIRSVIAGPGLRAMG